MALYQFQCTKCNHEFEDSVPVNDIKTVKCPECKEPAEVVIVNPRHYKHLSWSTWRVDHNKD